MDLNQYSINNIKIEYKRLVDKAHKASDDYLDGFIGEEEHSQIYSDLHDISLLYWTIQRKEETEDFIYYSSINTKPH